MDKLDILLVTGEIDYEQWVDGYSIFDALGWSENEFTIELDKRWLHASVPIKEVSCQANEKSI